MRILYSSLFLALMPFILGRLFWRSRKLPQYRRRIAERFAIFEKPSVGKPLVWIHVASVGEFIAFRPIIDELLSWDSHGIFITTMTPTGSERVIATYGDKVLHSYAPYDVSVLVKAFLNKVRPVLAIFVETELWPNILHHCKKHGVLTLLANGRMSAKSARGYRRIAWLSRPMITSLSCSAIQFEADAERFIALGLNPDTCLVSGSIKFDIDLNKNLIAGAKFLSDQIRTPNLRKVFIAASTHQGEEALILEAFAAVKQQFPSSLLILAPRHPDRFQEVAGLCRHQGYRLTLRSSHEVPSLQTDIMLADTMGELQMLYGCADVAFVGGSLVNKGGHNYLEPAAWGLPIITGPSTFNFSAISDMLINANAMFIADTPKLIAVEVLKLFSREDLIRRKGRMAAQVVAQNRGAKAKLILLIKGLLNVQ